MRMFHSSFIIDVKFGKEGAVLTDSQRLRFYVDAGNTDAMKTLKTWLQNVFLKGAPQIPTVLEYEERAQEAGAVELYVVKIITTGENGEN